MDAVFAAGAGKIGRIPVIVPFPAEGTGTFCTLIKPQPIPE